MNIILIIDTLKQCYDDVVNNITILNKLELNKIHILINTDNPDYDKIRELDDVKIIDINRDISLTENCINICSSFNDEMICIIRTNLIISIDVLDKFIKRCEVNIVNIALTEADSECIFYALPVNIFKESKEIYKIISLLKSDYRIHTISNYYPKHYGEKNE